VAGVSFYSDDPWLIGQPEAIVQLPKDDLSGEDLAAYIQETIMPLYQTERTRLEMLEAWATGKQPTDRRYVGQNKEKLALMRFSRNPWLKLLVSTFAQQLVVDGFRKDGATENEVAWDSWLANKKPAQQFTLNRATCVYGYCYERVTLGQNQFTDEPMAVMQVIDPQNAFGVYRDPYGDDYPAFLLEKRFDGTWRWWTPTNYAVFNRNGNDWKFVKTVDHPYKVVPFIRHLSEIDANGRIWGVVEPLIEIAARLDKTVLDRLLVQHYNSFKVRWATGLEQPDTEEKAAAAKMQLSQDTVLITSNEQAKFGAIAETDMSPFIAAYQSDLESFLTIVQLPPTLPVRWLTSPPTPLRVHVGLAISACTRCKPCWGSPTRKYSVWPHSSKAASKNRRTSNPASIGRMSKSNPWRNSPMPGGRFAASWVCRSGPRGT
jgi:hypothetical protein